MKKIIQLSFLIFMLGACHNYKNDVQRLQTRSDSMQQQSAFKDSSIINLLTDFNEIQVILDSIKKVEQLVTVQSNRGNELNASQKKKLMEDISLLNDLIQQNKDLTSSLRKKLNNANFEIGKLATMVAEFKKMVASLETQVQEKDAEIGELNNQARKLNIDIASLNQKVEEMENENQEKTETIETQIAQLNKAFYTFGSDRELKENGVIDKKGGILGLGKTATIKKDFNREYFTQIDIREFNMLPLMVKKAKVISVHPVGSFHISGEKSADTLFVDNPEEFWKVSRYLVIMAN